VRPARQLLRVSAACGIAVVLASCTTTAPPAAPGGHDTSGQPTPAAVDHGRFVAPVGLDDGRLTVDPPGTVTARISMRTAETMFAAADAVQGDYKFAILGLGVVSISSVSVTSSTPEQSTATSTATSAPTSTTMSASTSAPTPTPTSTPTLPSYSGRLAWVGIAWGLDCPAHVGDTTTRDVAVIFDAQSGRDVITYASRGAAVCGGPRLPPTVSRPDELVSIPWHPVGPASTAVSVTVPACGSFYGWTDQPGTGAAAVEVVARRPYDASCPSAVPQMQTVDDVVPLGNAQNQVPHAALGPVDGLRSLPAS
jgi:hypothetical protein